MIILQKSYAFLYEVVYINDLVLYLALIGFSLNVSQHPFSLHYKILSYVAVYGIIFCIVFQVI